MSKESRLACAPLSWGVIEIPDWGHQMEPETVLREAAELGFTAMEAGPEGFLPEDPSEVYRMLAGYGLRLVGGFVPTVLHDPAIRDPELRAFERRAEFFAEAGATTMVLAAATGSSSFEELVELDDEQWGELFTSLAKAEEIADDHGLAVSVHSHYGTVIESDEHLWRFLDGCNSGLCLDTAHLAIGGSDPVEVAKRAGKRVNHVHLKDVDLALARNMANRELNFKEAATAEAFRPLGRGDLELGEILRSLERSGYEGWYVLEQDCVVESRPKPGEGPVKDVRESLNFLKRELDAV